MNAVPCPLPTISLPLLSVETNFVPGPFGHTPFPTEITADSLDGTVCTKVTLPLKTDCLVETWHVIKLCHMRKVTVALATFPLSWGNSIRGDNIFL